MKKILIVEDVELNMELLVQLLEEDYELVTAVDGLTGVAVAETEKPHLILMDISLPGIDGYEATRRIRANTNLAHIPIVALTAHAMSGDEARVLAAGCDAYLTKPLNEDLLFSKLGELLSE
jgi:two-component system, cell cycle response regulator DivK